MDGLFIVNFERISCINTMTLLLTMNTFQRLGYFYIMFFRSNRSQMFFKFGVLKNFANFTGKHRCWSLFNKVAGLGPATLVKRDPNTGVFLRNFSKFLRTPYLIEHLHWLLLVLNKHQGQQQAVLQVL